MSKIFCIFSNNVFLIVNITCFYMSAMIEILNRNISSIKKKKRLIVFRLFFFNPENCRFLPKIITVLYFSNLVDNINAETI